MQHTFLSTLCKFSLITAMLTSSCLATAQKLQRQKINMEMAEFPSFIHGNQLFLNRQENY